MSPTMHSLFDPSTKQQNNQKLFARNDIENGVLRNNQKPILHFS